MDAQQFIDLVRRMRERQNAYYRQGRKYSDLIASKELEKAVDRALLDGVSIPVAGTTLEVASDDTEEGTQIGLFGE